MQKTYTTDNRPRISVNDLVYRLAVRKGVTEEEAAPMILGGEILEKWRAEHGGQSPRDEVGW